MRKRSWVLALSFLSGALPLGAQPEADDRPFFRPSTRPLSLDFEAGGVFDTNIDQNAAEIDSQGFVARVILEAQKPGRSRLLHFRYIGDFQSYTGSDRWDRGSSDVTAMYHHNLTNRLTLTGIGGYSLRGPTEEQPPASHYSGWAQLRYRPSRTAEIGVYGSYRWVRPETDANDENIFAAGFDFGGEVGRRTVWEFGYRREESDSNTPARRYRSDKLRAEYAVRVGRTSFGVRLDYTRRLFPESAFAASGIRIPRRDERWTPSAFWLYRFDSGKRLTVRWELRDRSTNYGRGAWSGQRLDALFRIPLVGRRRTPRPPGDGVPLPRLPDDVPTPDPPILHQLTYLSTKPEFSRERRPSTDESATFTRGSHWKEVLSVQGVPTGVSEKPQFFEDIWQYGASWVTFNNGQVVSWHDAGNLKLRPEPREKRTTPPPHPQRSDARAGSDSPASDLMKIEDPDETITSAFLRVAEPEIVLVDGRRLKGVLRKYEKGLAQVLLFLENDRTLLATIPENLIDKEKTNPLPSRSPDGGKR